MDALWLFERNRFNFYNRRNLFIIIFKPGTEKYSAVSGHLLADDRLTHSYCMCDDDTKLSMSCRFSLHHFPRMDLTGEGFNYLNLLKSH